MEKINWKQKLTSRKFWAALIGVITALLIAFNVPDMTVQQIVAVVSAFATLIAYIFGEGMVDAARLKASSTTEGIGTIVALDTQSLPATKTREEIEQLETNQTQQ